MSSNSVFASGRHANPLENAPVVKRENWGWAVALAIIAVVAFIIVIALQYIDFDAFTVA